MNQTMKQNEKHLISSQFNSYAAIFSSEGNINFYDNSDFQELYSISQIKKGAFTSDSTFCAFNNKKLLIIDLKESETIELTHDLDIIEVKFLDEKFVFLHKEGDDKKISIYSSDDSNLIFEESFSPQPNMDYFKLIKLGNQLFLQSDNLVSSEYQYFEIVYEESQFSLRHIAILDSYLRIQAFNDIAVAFNNKTLYTFDPKSKILAKLIDDVSYNHKIIENQEHHLLVTQLDMDISPNSRYKAYHLLKNEVHELKEFDTNELEPNFLFSNNKLIHVSIEENELITLKTILNFPSAN